MPADTLEERVARLEKMVEDIPDGLNIRFARVDRQLAEIREQQGIHGQRLIVIDRKVDTVSRTLETMGSKLDSVSSAVEALPAVLARIVKESGAG